MYVRRRRCYIVKYVLKRLFMVIPILLGITFLSFALMQTASGDVIDAIYEQAGGVPSEEIVAAKRAELGLDKPFIVQYFIWLGGVLTGNMGNSYVSNRPVFQDFMSHLPATVILTLSSIFITVLFSIPLGILSAVKHNKITDYIIRILTFVGNAMPGFFLSLVLLYLFSVQLKWLPATGNNGFVSIILPTVTLAIAMTAKYTRQVRAAVLDELKKDYVLGARSRGVKERIILYFSVLKSSLLTIVTLLGLSIGSLLGGTAIIESIFMWPGVGKLAVDAITMRDYPVIQMYVIWMAVIFVVINLLTDIIYYYLDPRIRLQKES